MPFINCKTLDAEGNFSTIYQDAWIADAIGGTLPLWKGSKKLVVRDCSVELFKQSFEARVPADATCWGFVDGGMLGFWDDDGKMIGVPLQAKYES